MTSPPRPSPAEDAPGSLLEAELALPAPAAGVVERGLAVVRAVRVRWLLPPRLDPTSRPSVYEVLVAGRIMLRGPLVLLHWVRRPKGQPSPDARPHLVA